MTAPSVNETHLFIGGAEAGDAQSRQVSMDVGGWRGVGTYAFGGSTAAAFIVLRDSSAGGAATVALWDATSSDAGSLVMLSFDTQRQRVAGTFSFRATSASGQAVVVSNGSFDGRLFIYP